MKVNEFKANTIFDSQDVYDVPSYQRDYKWGKKEVEVLLRDLKEFSKSENYSENNSYYFGNIIVQGTEPGTVEAQKANWYLIDGQQRISTLFLINVVLITLKSKYKLLINTEKKKKDELLLEHFDLAFKSKKYGNKFKLLNKDDSLEKFIYKNFDVSNENFEGNFSVVKKFLKDEINSADDVNLWVSLVDNISFGRVELQTKENAEMIFENINSKGKPLTLSELLKNKLLLVNNLLKKQAIAKSADQQEQEKINTCNEEIEEKIISIFDLIENHQNSISKKIKYSEIKELGIKKENEYLRSICTYLFGKEIESDSSEAYKSIKGRLDLLEDQTHLKNFIEKFSDAIYHLRILNGFVSKENESSIYIKWILEKSPAFIPYLLLIVKEFFEKNILNSKNINTDIESKIVDNFKEAFNEVAKASILTNGFSGINLWKKVPSNINLLNNSFDLKSSILNLIKNDLSNEEAAEPQEIQIANLDESMSVISNFDFYKHDRTLIKYLLLLIERKLEKVSGSKEITDWKSLYIKATDSDWTIEHIIPQTINPATVDGKDWTDNLVGFNYMSILDKPGNLTLISKRMNSTNRNFMFSTKAAEFKKSNLKINNEISENTIFGEEEYEKRSSLITERIVEILF